MRIESAEGGRREPFLPVEAAAEIAGLVKPADGGDLLDAVRAFQQQGAGLAVTLRVNGVRQGAAISPQEHAPQIVRVAAQLRRNRGARLKVNGRAVPVRTVKGYARVVRCWQAGDRIELSLPMPVERIEAHPHVRQDAGRVALQRGPVVYCLEETDNGKDLNDLVLPRTSRLTATFKPKLLGGVVVIKGQAQRRDVSTWAGQLYDARPTPLRRAPFQAVPYAVWGNRKPGEMLVWLLAACRA